MDVLVLPSWLAFYTRDEPWGFWAAVEPQGGEFLGWFHLRPGLATEGSRVLIDRAFTEHGARRVYATTMVVNAASRRVMEKAGMRLVRSFHGEWPEAIPGDEHGDVEYAIARTQWEADRGA